HEDAPFAGQPLGNPVGVVLREELLILLCAGAIGAGIAPAIEQIAAFAAAAANVAGGLRRGRAVIDDPEFAKFMDAHGNLIEIGIVRDRVEVRDIWIDAPLRGGWWGLRGTVRGHWLVGTGIRRWLRG